MQKEQHLLITYHFFSNFRGGFASTVVPRFRFFCADTAENDEDEDDTVLLRFGELEEVDAAAVGKHLRRRDPR